jgi:phosphatidate cytidylyltransferase
MENKKLKDLLIRTASGAVLLIIVVGALLLSKWSAVALFAVIMLGGLAEFYKLCQKRDYKPVYVIGVAASLVLCCNYAVILLNGSDKILFVAALFMLLVLLLVPMTFVTELWRKSETPIANVATTFMGVLYVSYPMSVVMYIPYLLVNDWNPWIMLAFISIIWINDVFAYLVGVSIGKHRLCERISPKKSWEGFFGGLIGAVGAAVLFGHLFGGNLYIWGGLGVVTALAGVAGDLVESMMKREAGVKDSGSIMPGHGGFLDRFDALFMAVPFAFVYLMLVMSI